MGLFSYLYSKLTLKISQTALNGFRDPKWWVYFEPFGFLRWEEFGN